VRTIILITALLLGSITSADTPARLVVGEDSIEASLRLPRNLNPGRYEVACEAEIGPTGRARYVACYQVMGLAPQELRSAVLDAVQSARYEPATRAGIAANVYLVLAVLVDTSLGEPLVLAIPNNGADRKRYGLLYTAPQRFVDLQPRSTLRPLGVLSDSVLWMKMRIDENGKVTDYAFENAERTSIRAIEKTEKGIPRMEFMPGYHEGKPAVMFYMEPSYTFVHPRRP
jgi:hypothetical protein